MSKFIVWIEQDELPNKIKSYEELLNASDDTAGQAKSGFLPGQYASSVMVNSMLRQNSLFLSAFLNMIEFPDTVTLQSTVESVTNAFKSTNLGLINQELRFDNVYGYFDHINAKLIDIQNGQYYSRTANVRGTSIYSLKTPSLVVNPNTSNTQQETIYRVWIGDSINTSSEYYTSIQFIYSSDL